MHTFHLALALLLTSAFTSAANAQIFYNNTGRQNIVAAFHSADEIADDTPFTGIQHVASFTFEYENNNSFAVDATVRFYTVNASTGGVGDLVATIPVPHLGPGSFQLITVNLPAAQQFDWAATPGIYHLSNVSGGFVSFQFTGPDFETGWYEAGGASLDGFYDHTTGQFITFQQDSNASFYLELSSSAQAPTLSSLVLKSATVTGGANDALRISLTTPALAGGFVVKLMSSNPRIAAVPASVTVPAGARAITAQIRTAGVQKSSLITISASHGSAMLLTDLTVNP